MEQMSLMTRNWAMVALFLAALVGCNDLMPAPEASANERSGNAGSGGAGAPVLENTESIPVEDGVTSPKETGRKPQGGAGGSVSVPHEGGASGSVGAAGKGGSHAEAGTTEPEAGSGGSSVEAGTGGVGGSTEPEAGTGGSNEAGTGGSGEAGTHEPEAGTGGNAGEGGMGGNEAGTGGDSGEGGTGEPEAGTGGMGGTTEPPQGGTGGTGSEAGTGGSTAPTCVAEECNIPNATALCDEDDACAIDSCNNGYDDCNRELSDGCEMKLDTVQNCGACGNACDPGDSCEAGSCVDPESLACGTWDDDPAFKQFKVWGTDDVTLVKGGWSFGSDDYVTAGPHGFAVVAHRRNNGPWVQEDLPGHERPGVIWGSSLSYICVVSTGDSGTTAMLACKTSVDGEWVEDPNKPSAKAFVSIWGSDASNAYLLGWRAGGKSFAWRKSGSNWIDMQMPYSYSNGACHTIWGLNPQNVFVTCEEQDEYGTPIKGHLLHWNGNSWSEISSPNDLAAIRAIHGTSIDDLWIAGVETPNTPQGVVYQLSNAMSVWTRYEVDGSAQVNNILSLRYGTAIVGSSDSGAAALMSTIDGTGIQTRSVGGALGSEALWNVPGTNTVHFIHMSPTVSGFYTSSCQ